MGLNATCLRRPPPMTREQACYMLSRLKRESLILQESEKTLLDWQIAAESSLLEQQDRRAQIDEELTTYCGMYAENCDADVLQAPPVALQQATEALAALSAAIAEGRVKIRDIEAKVANYRKLRADVEARIGALEEFLTPELAAGVAPAQLSTELSSASSLTSETPLPVDDAAAAAAGLGPPPDPMTSADDRAIPPLPQSASTSPPDNPVSEQL